MIRKFTLLLSIALHALVFALIAIPRAPKKPAPIVVELAQAPEPPKQEHTQGTQPRARSQAHGDSTSRTQQATKLDLKFSTQSNLRDSWLHSKGDVAVAPAAPGSDPMISLEQAGQGYSRATQYAGAMDVTFTNENLGFFDSLHRKVDGVLNYPDDFVKARIEGRVQIEAVVSKQGLLTDFSIIRADNDILHAYALALIMHALKDPLSEKRWLQTESAVVVFDFDFRTRVIGTNEIVFDQGAKKNRLAFGRQGTVDPLVSEKLQELFTHYVPPIIPIPGGFYVDLVSAVQYVHNIATNAPLESEVRLARAKSIHKDLLSTIRRSPSVRPTATPDQPTSAPARSDSSVSAET